jgi:hypothetical protein
MAMWTWGLVGAISICALAGQDAAPIPAPLAGEVSRIGVANDDATISAVPIDPVPVGLRGEIYSAKPAANRAHSLLGYLPLPNAAIPVPDPSGLTGQPPHDVPSRNLVSRSRWWSLSGTPAEALSYLHAHLPTGFMIRQRSTSAAGLSRLYYTLLDPPAAHATITVYLVQSAGHVDLRVDGQATWLPRRAASEFIPFGTPVVDLTAGPAHPGAKGLPHRQLRFRGPEISKLVPWFDFSIPEAPGLPPCAAAANALAYSATFRLGHRVVVFRWIDGCDLVSVAVNDRASVPLSNPPTGLVAYLLKIPGKQVTSR